MSLNTKEIEKLYRTHGPAVYRRCLHLLGNELEAEDAVHDIFVKLFRGGFRGDANVTTWMYRVTTNHCLNRLRDRKPVVALDESPEVVVDELGRIEARDSVLALLSSLDDVTAQIAVYHFVDGMPQEEVERVMTISRKTISRRIKAIREQLGAQSIDVVGRLG